MLVKIVWWNAWSRCPVRLHWTKRSGCGKIHLFSHEDERARFWMFPKMMLAEIVMKGKIHLCSYFSMGGLLASWSLEMVYVYIVHCTVDTEINVLARRYWWYWYWYWYWWFYWYWWYWWFRWYWSQCPDQAIIQAGERFTGVHMVGMGELMPWNDAIVIITISSSYYYNIL